MSSWTRGPRCGIENCKSRLWRIVNGQRVCQNGHVKEGEVEVGEDEDDFINSQGRVLNLKKKTRSIYDNKSVQFAGKDANALYLQCVQYILRKQVEWLVESQGLSPQLVRVVKSLWGLYLEDTQFASTVFDNPNDNDGNENDNVIENDNENGNVNDNNDNNDNDDENDNDDDENERKRPKGKVIVDSKVDIIHTPLLCYLGCVLLRIPVYIYDFNRWIYRYQLPYMKGLLLLPPSMVRHLGSPHHIRLTPRTTPTEDKLHEHLQLLVDHFSRLHGLQFPRPNWRPLVFKVVYDLMLPPEVYYAVDKLLFEELKMQLDLPKRATSRNLGEQLVAYPEVMIVAAVVLCTKMCFGLDSVNRPTVGADMKDSPATVAFDVDVWIDLVRKLWIEDESFSEADDRDVLYWDKDKLDRYLAWYEDSFIHPSKKLGTSASESLSVPERRLLSLFPLGRYNDKGQVEQDSTGGGGDNGKPSVVPRPGIMMELNRFLQSTLQSQWTEGDPTETDQDSSPGSRYPSFRIESASNPPPVIDTLCRASARMAAASLSTFRSVLFNLEKKTRQTMVVQPRRNELAAQRAKAREAKQAELAERARKAAEAKQERQERQAKEKEAKQTKQAKEKQEKQTKRAKQAKANEASQEEPSNE